MEPVPSDDKKWYVMRVTYQREVIAKDRLDKMEIENFLPLRSERRRNAHGRFCKVRVPMVHNFLFVRSERSTIDHIKTFSLPYLRYATTTTDGRRTIMTVPEKQMQSFIAVTGDEEQQAIYLDPASVDLSKGDKVRIIGGQLAGVEGTFMKIKGGNRVVVKIDFVAAVATAEIPPQLIEKL